MTSAALENKIYLNFIPISTGGGLQNALSFLSFIEDVDSFHVLIRTNKTLEFFVNKKGFEYTVIGKSLTDRLLFEIFHVRRIIKKDAMIFSIFGPPLLGTIGRCYNINGCAYSNLFYPELDFWGHLTWWNKRKKQAIDLYRKMTLSMAAEVIFETSALLKRAQNDSLFKRKKIHVVRMSPSSLISRQTVDVKSTQKNGVFQFIFLTGNHPNKRVRLLPKIAKRLLILGCLDFQFKITFNLGLDRESKLISREIEKHEVKEHVIFIGTVAPNNVAQVIDASDAIINIALLESFSNNFVEAWEMQKPLIVTDADWSRDSCQDAALYIDPEDAVRSAVDLKTLINDKKLRSNLVFNGSKLLDEFYPSQTERMSQYLHIIDNARKTPAIPG